MNVTINGCKGRMGTALLACVSNFPQINVVGQVGSDGGIYKVIQNTDVVVDFSNAHTTTPALAELCASQKKAMVIGTTGHSDEERSKIGKSAQMIPIVMASNFSTGVNTLFWLTRKAAEILGPNFDLEVVEMHHRHKKDAPSGTAHTLAKILAEARSRRLDEVVRNGRAGIVGARSPEEIGIHSIRGGDVVGEHTVIFADNGERVELTHKASSRETFANGALRAAQWVVGKPPGLYDMQDVLGLR